MEKSRQIKKQIRREYLQKRNGLSAFQAEGWSREICSRLMCWEPFSQAETILFYYPLGNEVNLLEAAGEALRSGKQVAFPRTEGDRIRFYLVQDLDRFREGPFHVMEPEGGELLVRMAPEQTGDGKSQKSLLVLTPGVAFDRNKNRMGYGKGYYDRYLAELSAAVPLKSKSFGSAIIKLGIAYGCQIAEEIPREQTDIPMDYMITEDGIW